MGPVQTLDPRSAVVAAGVRAAAASDCAAAASDAGVKVRILDGIENLSLAAALFSQVWDLGAGDDPKIPVDVLRALSHAGGYIAGAYSGPDLVGASLGFARLDGTGRSLHSHITGVVAGSAGAGVGRALKLHQRHWALERDIAEIVWTFDPVVRRNAYFNVSKLGARIVAYYDNFYGPMPDGLNHRDESDRCLARWDLLDDRVKTAVAASGPRRDASTGPAAGLVLLDQEGRLSAFTGAEVATRLLVWVPEDIVAIRRTNPVAAAGWRAAVRKSLGAAIRAGWCVSVVRPDGWYELERAGNDDFA